MKSARVELTPEARQEIDDAFEWYLERSVQTAEWFVEETRAALEQIAASPDLWPLHEAGTRRYVLRRFPYSIIYRTIPAGVQVVAVAHQKRRPRYWRSRLARGPKA